MPNRLAIGAAHLASRLKDHASETVTLSDGGYSVEWEATVSLARHQSQDTNGMLVDWESMDFIGTAADLILGGKAVAEPKRGMRFTRTVGTTTEVFEVQAPYLEQPFRWCDPSHTRIRIHTVQVAT
jgi:hypothetical protein